ncbi:MAG: hypothetical protein AAGJ29_00875 [Pseudomonadota bacterium]
MFYFSRLIDAERVLCLAPITQRQLDVSDSEIFDCSGYFLFEQTGVTDCREVKILAQVHSDEAALAIKEMMQLA